MIDIREMASLYKKIKDGKANYEEKTFFELELARASIKESVMIERLENYIKDNNL